MMLLRMVAVRAQPPVLRMKDELNIPDSIDQDNSEVNASSKFPFGLRLCEAESLRPGWSGT